MDKYGIYEVPLVHLHQYNAGALPKKRAAPPVRNLTGVYVTQASTVVCTLIYSGKQLLRAHLVLKTKCCCFRRIKKVKDCDTLRV